MSRLRDYTARYKDGDPVEAAVIEGNFVKINSITYPFDATRRYDTDFIVFVEFDDKGKIALRAGDSVKNRPYERLRFSVENPSGTGVPVTAIVNYTAGHGEVEGRAYPAVPKRMKTFRVSIPFNSEQALGSFDASIVERRINIPLGQANGLWFGTDLDVSVGTPFGLWLDVGVVDYISYAGVIRVKNEGVAGSVNFSYTEIYRDD